MQPSARYLAPWLG